jgi:hypothetical protein
MPWPHIKLIALALLLTVLAHDAVMAGDPHHAGHDASDHHASPAMPAHHTGTASSIAGHDGGYLVAGSHVPCGPMIAVRPGTVSDLLPDPATHSLIRPLRADSAPMQAPVDDEEPAHPPDVRRALLQVFLN